MAADLGGTFLRCALVRPDGAMTNRERIRLRGDAFSRGQYMWLELVEAIAVYADAHSSHLDPDTPISFAFPGPMRDGKPVAAPTVLSGMGELPDFRSLLSARTQRDVILLNDVSAAAWYFSERIAADRFAVVTISSGVGAKIFDRRHPLGVLDDIPSAGEIGHLVVEHGPDAVRCDCGGRGHLGALASARGIERSARMRAQFDPVAFSQSACVTRFGATQRTLSNEDHLAPALAARDDWSLHMLRAGIEPLATVLATLAAGYGLEAIAIFGGFAQQLGELYRELLHTAIHERLHDGTSRFDGRPAVYIAGRDEEPSLCGMATYSRRQRSFV